MYIEGKHGLLKKIRQTVVVILSKGKKGWRMKGMRFFAIVLIMTIMFAGCVRKQYHNKADQFVSTLDDETLIGQMLMIGLPSNTVNEETIAIIKKYKPGGVVLFGHNLDQGSCQSFVQQLQQAAIQHIGIPLFVAIDQEGGRVKRIRHGVTQFPSNFALGVVNDERKVYTMAKIKGIQLRQMGINMNLAPVLDVNNNIHNPVINIRSFGCNPHICANLGSSYIKGLQDAGCIAVAKHFPGHGDTHLDSHYTLPVINKSIDDLRKVELIPFKKAIESGVESIMTAHIVFPQLDKSYPVTMSPYILTGNLRQGMGFNGLIISDDLEMKGFSKGIGLTMNGIYTGDMTHGSAAVKSLRAGVDVLLISSYGNHVLEIIQSAKNLLHEYPKMKEDIKSKVLKIIELKLRYKIMDINNGRVSSVPVVLSQNQSELLSKADILNEELSQKSIVFYSDKNFSDYIINPSVNAVLLSTNSDVVKAFRNMNVTVKERIPAPQSHDIIIIDASSYTLQQMRSLLSAGSAGNAKPLLLITGNPYPYIIEFKDYPMLMSFSDTTVSLRQMASCLQGNFMPKISHPCLTIHQ